MSPSHRHTLQPRPRVLVVDDDPLHRRMVQRVLASHFDVVPARDGADALAQIALHGYFDVIISDLEMPRLDGVGLHRSLFRAAPGLLSRLVFVSAAAPPPRVRRLANPVLAKPVDPDVLRWVAMRIATGCPVYDLVETPSHPGTIYPSTSAERACERSHPAQDAQAEARHEHSWGLRASGPPPSSPRG